MGRDHIKRKRACRGVPFHVSRLIELERFDAVSLIEAAGDVDHREGSSTMGDWVAVSGSDEVHRMHWESEQQNKTKHFLRGRSREMCIP